MNRLAKTRSRLKSFVLPMCVVLGGLEVVYVVGANWVLRSNFVPSLVNTRPEKLKLHYDSAWTIVPGLVHLKGFSIQGQDASIRWKIEVPKIRTLLSLSSFAARTLRSYSVVGEGGAVRLSRSEPIGSEPTGSEESNPNTRPPFKLKFAGIDLAGLTELAIFEYSYQGGLDIEGDFDLWPGRSLEVHSGDLQFHEGKVILAGRTLCNTLSGRIDASVKPWNPKTDSPADLFDLLSAELTFKGELEDAKFLSYYVQSIPWLKILGVSGVFSLDARIVDGAFGSPSRAQISATQMGAGLGRTYEARGSGDALWVLDSSKDESLMKMKIELKNYKAYDVSRDLLIAMGQSLSLVANSRDLGLRKIFSDLSDLSAILDMSKVEVTDLRFINRFIPKSQDLEVLSGTASLEAKLEVSTRRSASPGFFKVEAKGARARFGEKTLGGDFAFNAVLEDTEEGSDTFRVSGTSVEMRNVLVDSKDKKKTEAWAGDVELSEAWIHTDAPVAFHGQAVLAFDDARPILTVLAATSSIARLVEGAARMKNLKGQSEFKIGSDVLEFRDLRLKSSDLDLTGDLRFVGKSRRIRALIEYRILEVGVDINDSKTRTKIIKSRKWYEKLPKWPALQVPAS